MADSRGAEPLTSADRAALEFLARVYDVAESKGALKHLPAWMHKYRAPSKTVHGVGREPVVFPADEATTTDVTVAQRRTVLRIVAAQSGHEKEANASTSTEGALQLVGLYERAHEDGVRAIERLAKSWMLETLRQHACDQSQLLMRANTQRISLQWAAKYVHARVRNQLANRSGDLDRVLYPKNRRIRDGDLEQRILRVQYILAVRAVLADASSAAPDVPAPISRRQDSRGLSPTPLNRQTDRADGFAVVPKDASLLASLQFLARIKWHPRFGAIVEAWQADWSNGFRELAEAVGEALKANADLAKRLTDEPSRVWAFGAAIQQALGTPTVPGTRGLVKYAFVYAGSVKTPLEEALETIGVITTLLAAFGGPAAPVGVVADAVVQSASAAMVFSARWTRTMPRPRHSSSGMPTGFPKEALFSPGCAGRWSTRRGGSGAARGAGHSECGTFSGPFAAALRRPKLTLPSSAEVSQARKELAEQLEALAREAGFQTPQYRDLHLTPQQTDVFVGAQRQDVEECRAPVAHRTWTCANAGVGDRPRQGAELAGPAC